MTPSSGTITIDNLNYKDNELEIKKRISFLTGNTKLYKDLSAYELHTMCGEYYGLSTKEINNRMFIEVNHDTLNSPKLVIYKDENKINVHRIIITTEQVKDIFK